MIRHGALSRGSRSAEHVGRSLSNSTSVMVGMAILLPVLAGSLVAVRPSFGLLLLAPFVVVLLMRDRGRPSLFVALLLTPFASLISGSVSGLAMLVIPGLLMLMVVANLFIYGDGKPVGFFSSLQLPDILGAMLLLWITLSYTFSPYTDQNINGNIRVYVASILWPSLSYVTGRIIFSNKHHEKWILICGLSATIAGVTFWIEVIQGGPLMAEGYYWFDEGRAGSLLNGPNYASKYVAVAFAAVLPFISRGATMRHVAIIMVVFLLSTLLTTKSISGTILFLVGICTLTAVRIGIRTFWLAIAAVFLGGTIYETAVLNGITSLAQNLRDPDYVTASFQGRLEMVESAQVALLYLSRDPLLLVTGIGFLGWQHLEALFATGSVLESGRAHGLHNMFLTVLLETGIPGLVLLVAFLAGIGVRAWQRRSARACLSAGLVLVVLAAAGVTGTMLVVPQVIVLPLFVLAAAVGRSQCHDDDVADIEAHELARVSNVDARTSPDARQLVAGDL